MDALLNDVSGLDWSEFFTASDVNRKLHIFNSFILALFDHHVRLRRLRPLNRVNPWFNKNIERAMRERDICYAVWKARKTNEDKIRLKQIRRTVTRLVKTAKRSYMAKFLNPSLPSRVLWKNLKMIGATEDPSDGPVIFSPEELNTFYSLDAVNFGKDFKLFAAAGRKFSKLTFLLITTNMTILFSADGFYTKKYNTYDCKQKVNRI